MFADGKPKGSASDPTFSSAFQDRADAINSAYSGDQIGDTFSDKLANWFGFRSSADKARMELEQRRREALLQLKTTESEQEYNSEAAKAARMRQAGINPDLQGLGEASEASEFNEPEAAADLSGLTTASDVLQGFSGALSSALSMYASIQSLRENGIRISNEELRFADESSGHTLNLIKSLYSKEGFRKYFEGETDDSGNSVFTSIPDKALRDLGVRSRRARKAIISRSNSLMNSFLGQTEKYKNFGEYLSAQSGYLKEANAWFRPSSDLFASDKDISNTLRFVAAFERRLILAQSKYQAEYFENASGKAKGEAEANSSAFQRDYYAVLSGKSRAEYENSAAEFNKFVQKSKKDLFRRLTGKDATTFDLVLALQLMGETDFISNSGISSVGKLVL